MMLVLCVKAITLDAMHMRRGESPFRPLYPTAGGDCVRVCVYVCVFECALMRV